MRMVRVEHRGALARRMLHPKELETLSATQEASVLKHVSTVGMQGPEAALARLVGAAGDLDKAVIEWKVMTEWVLPPLSVLAVIRETIHDEFVDVAEGKHLLRGALDGHSSQRDVGVRRLLVTVGVLSWPRHGFEWTLFLLSKFYAVSVRRKPAYLPFKQEIFCQSSALICCSCLMSHLIYNSYMEHLRLSKGTQALTIMEMKRHRLEVTSLVILHTCATPASSQSARSSPSGSALSAVTRGGSETLL